MIDILRQQLAKADLMKTMTGIVVMAVFCVLVMVLLYKEMPEGNREIVIHVLGIIEGAVMAIVTYYYGSSKGSQDKAKTIDKMTEKT